MNTDVQGDTVSATQEGYDIVQEGLTSTLGNNNPFYYDQANNRIDYYKNVSLSGYSNDQQDIINRFVKTIDDKAIATVEIVNSHDPIQDSRGISKSLLDRGGYAMTVPDAKTGNYTVFIARDPADNWGQQGVFSAPEWQRGVASLHELGGHTYLFIMGINNKNNNSLNNRMTEQFEINFRRIYKVGEYSTLESLWFGLWSIFGLSDPHPAGSNKSLGGEGEKHK